MNTTIIRTEEEFNKLEEVWKTLEQENPKTTYYSSYHHIRSWWEVYGKKGRKKLLIILCEQDNKAVAIAPFYIEEKKRSFLRFRELRFLGKGDYFDLLYSTDYKEDTLVKRIFGVLEDVKREYDRIHLEYIPVSSPVLSYALKSPELNRACQVHVEIPQILLSGHEDFQSFEKTIPQKTRKYRNKLQKEVGYQFRVTQSPSRELLEKLRALHTKEQMFLRKEKGRSERRMIFENRDRTAFFEKVLEDQTHVFAFYLISDEGEILTYNLAYLYKDILYSWNSAYDPTYEKYPLAKIRYYEVLQYLFAEKDVRVFDLGAGRYPWKFEWTPHFTTVYKIEYWVTTSLKAKFLQKMSVIKTIRDTQ